MPRFEATLAGTDSATAALNQWCAARHIASPPRISAALVALSATPAAPPPPADLGVLDGPVGYRQVRLSCGKSVLSVAQNWYARDALTGDMNRALDQTDTPFGTAVAALDFRRERLSARRGAGPGCPRGTIVSHRARLVLPSGRTLALLIECYTRANLR